jgi:hypothetical protein
MDSIATNDDLAVTGAELEEQNKDIQPSDMPKVGESINTVQTSEKTENIDVQGGDIGHDFLGKILILLRMLTEKQAAERLKRKTKPSTKSIENRIQSDKAKLDRLWEKVQKCISQLQDAPNSVDEIRQAISQVRSNFNIYQETWLSFADFLAHSGTPQCLQERVRMEGIINNHKQFVHENITQGNRRNEEIMLEMRSLRSSSGSRASSMSSTALRARARAEVAAAIKKAELQKKRLLVESQSAFVIQQAELALARHKLDEQARLEALRLEKAAAVVVAKANAIDD